MKNTDINFVCNEYSIAPITDLAQQIRNKIILLRVDFNVPFDSNYAIRDITRIRNSKKSIEYLINHGASIILLTHLSNRQLSNKHIIDAVSSTLNLKINMCEDFNSIKSFSIKSGEILLLENLRIHPGEEQNSTEFAKLLSDCGYAYVNDAFSSCHREHTSIVGIPKFISGYAGFSLINELWNLEKTIGQPLKGRDKFITAIIGGKKISTKLPILKNLVGKVGSIVITGALANTFLKAKGYNIGESIYDSEMLFEVNNLINECTKYDCDLVLPIDLAVTSSNNSRQEITPQELSDNSNILDIGHKTANVICNLLSRSKFVIWNGPVGYYDDHNFAYGTNTIGSHIAELTKKNKIISVAGGGETLDAIKDFVPNMTYCSSGGGAFLSWLKNKHLPGIAVIKFK